MRKWERNPFNYKGLFISSNTENVENTRKQFYARKEYSHEVHINNLLKYWYCRMGDRIVKGIDWKRENKNNV